MSDLKLDQNNDLDVSTGSPVMVEDADATAQQIRIRLRMFLGEWFLDTRQGMPYFQKIVGKKRRKALIDSIFRKAIATTPGVKSVDSLMQTFDGATRKLIISFSAAFASGQILSFEEEFII